MAEIRVFAPATIANIAIGFDILGLALEQPGDEIIARKTNNKSGLTIRKIYNDDNKLPTDPLKNTATVAGQAVLDALGESSMGIEFDIHKKMPIGSGIGSSAASAAAGAFAVNELLGSPFSKKELLPFAVKGEQSADGAFHADNVAPSLLGGIILVKNEENLFNIQLPIPENLYISLICPSIEILTKNARDVIQPTVPMDRFIKQSFNLAGFISSLFLSDYGLMKECLEDHVIEHQRSYMIPHFKDIQETAIRNNAIGCSISGAGPSIFALSEGKKNAEVITESMQKILSDAKIPFTSLTSKVNKEGVLKLPL